MSQRLLIKFVIIYIYIYIKGQDQLAHEVTLSNVTQPNKFSMDKKSLNLTPLYYMFSIFLTRKPNFVPIGCYLLFNPETYLLCIILKYINLKFKHLINDIVIDL